MNKSFIIFNFPSKIEQSNPGRPLTVLLSWLMSKDSHTKKFVKFYTDLGFDVLKIRISPFDLIRPVRGTQARAQSV
jgi:hypothetical protein